MPCTSQPEAPGAREAPCDPTVGDLTGQIAARDAVLVSFMDSGWLCTKEEALAVLNLWQEDSPDTLPLVHKYLSSDNPNVHAYMDGYIGSVIVGVIDEMKDPRFLREWREQKHESWSAGFRSDISRRWHALTVSEDTGYEWDDTEQYAEWIKSTQTLIETNHNDVNLPKTDSYWRGMASLTLVQLINDHEIFWDEKDVIAHVPGFIELTGNHPDLKVIMDVAVPRNLIDADAINSILRQQGEGAAAVGDGVL